MCIVRERTKIINFFLNNFKQKYVNRFTSKNGNLYKNEYLPLFRKYV